MRLIFRVDGNAEIGMGHLARCFTLADMLYPSFEIVFCCIHAPKTFIKNILSSGYKFFLLETNNDFLNLITLNDIVVLDSYEIGKKYHHLIKLKAAKLVCIDDLHNKEFEADLIINHSPSVKESDYIANTNTLFALGPKYALIRPEFTTASKLLRNNTNMDKVLICFGGSDTNNLTLHVLNILLNLAVVKKIIVITGVNYKYKLSIDEIVVKDSRIVHLHNIEPYEMILAMNECDLAIVPASGTLFECLAIGLSCITCYYVDNQKPLHDYVVNYYKIPTLNDDKIGINFEKLKYLFLNKNEIQKQNTKIIRDSIKQSSNNLKNIFNQLIAIKNGE
jgi:UDP-2,4-diacetamido-2,4,6-trideoxy-beta-L-altropyranose hydrolase